MATTLNVPSIIRSTTSTSFQIIDPYTSSSVGNSFNIIAGTGTTGGSVYITPGTNTSGVGYSTTFQAGIAPYTGGSIYFNAGNVQTGIQGSIYSSGYSINEGYSNNISAIQSVAVNQWTSQTATTNVAWNSVCWSPDLSLFCTIGYGTHGAMTSPNGITWTTQNVTTNITWSSICWSPKLSIFCTVGYGGTKLAMTSPNGITWTTQNISTSYNWFSVCWSSDLSIFCAVGNGASNGSITISPNGITWTTVSEPISDTNWRSVCWSSELAIFCVAGFGGSTCNIMTSSDGTNWVTRTVPDLTTYWISICWSPELSLFCAVGSSFGKLIITSPNGITWTTQNFTSSSLNSVCWNSQLSLFCACSSGNPSLITSSNGIDWISVNLNNQSSWSSICWSPFLNIFCIVASSVDTSKKPVMISNSTFINYTVPITSWTTRTLSTSRNWGSICWSSDLELLCIIADGTPSTSGISSDGIIWTYTALPTGSTWRNVIWVSELSLFCSCALSGSNSRVMTSPNGTMWTTRTSSISYSWAATCWSPDLGIFCVLSSTIGTGNSMTSSDCVTWATHTSGISAFEGNLCWSSELMIFCCTYYDGVATTTKSAISSNGITWTTYVISVIINSGICWSPELALFCSFGNNYFARSSNGTSWITQAASITNSYCISWSPALHIFCIASQSKYTISQDGINWTSVSYGTAFEYWYNCLCWSLKLNSFCGVSYLSKTIMSSPFTSINYNKQVNIGTRGTGSTTTISGNDIIIGSNAGTIDIGSNSEEIILNANTTINGTMLVDNSGMSISVNTTIISNIGITSVQSSVIGSWTTGSMSTSYRWQAICWSPKLGLFCAATRDQVSGSTHRIIRSYDGINWLTTSSGDNNSWLDVCWSQELEIFCAVALAGSAGYRVSTSYDAITWTSRPTPVDLIYHSICWSPEIGIFVSPAYSSDVIIYSANGFSWVSLATGFSSAWSSVCWSPYLGIFCAVSQTAAYTIRSTNGINWVSDSAPNNTWNGICWCSELNLFCAAGNLSSVYNVMTSSNGSTWTLRTVPSLANNRSFPCWSPQLSLLCVGGGTSGNGNIIYSRDAITWFSATCPSRASSLCWSPELSVFCGIPFETSVYFNSIRSNSNFTGISASSVTFPQKLEIGTPVTCDLTIQGSSIKIGNYASSISIGSYASNIIIGDYNFTRSYYYIADGYTTHGSNYTGNALYNTNVYSTVSVQTGTYSIGNYGYYTSSPYYFYAPVSGLYFVQANGFMGTGDGSTSKIAITNEKSSQQISSSSYILAAGVNSNIYVSGVFYMNVGDPLSVYTTNIAFTNVTRNRLNIIKIG